MTSPRRAFVVGMGVLSPVGCSTTELLQALRSPTPALAPLSLFAAGLAERLPVGQVPGLPFEACAAPPRTHTLAARAMAQALAGHDTPPDAVVIGVTTGGMPTTEELLRRGETDPAAYRLHAAGSVAEELARRCGCTGPTLTVSTACSSAAVALAVALELIRTGRARTVLAGGVDALCRLTYHGFRLLQLIDPAGARPLDRDRKGMSVAEGAGLLLLQAGTEPPPGALAELRGAGLSCDAFHPTRPHPEGEGAGAAMARALADAGVEAGAIGYVNLHGTGTPDNDAAEARAVCALASPPPPASSTKGLTGHPLAAAGGLEAIIGVLALQAGLLPANTGRRQADPQILLEPLSEPRQQALALLLSNSLGFGGNNASLVLGQPKLPAPGVQRAAGVRSLRVLRCACYTGAGDTEATLAALRRGERCDGLPAAETLQQQLPPALTRRLKRLPKLVLALAEAVRGGPDPRAVFFGTAWGPLSETADFLDKLTASGDQFSSPTDFIGSVHNAPAAQVAIRCQAKGANVTATSQACSFEQALTLAGLLATADDLPLLLLAADEAHAALTPRFDPAAAGAGALSDGGGALLCTTDPSAPGVRLSAPFLGCAADETLPPGLLDALGGAQAIARRFAAWLVAWPEDEARLGEARLAALRAATGFGGPVVRYREWLGRHGTVAAAATAVAVRWLEQGALPAALTGGATDLPLTDGRGLLLLALGRQLAAVEVGA